MILPALVAKHYRTLRLAAAPAGQDAEDLVGDFIAELLTGKITLPSGSDFAEWSHNTISSRARKAKNRVLRETLHPKALRYTEMPSTVAGEITEEELWTLCTAKTEELRLNPAFEYRLVMLKTVFSSLRTPDQEFLMAYQIKTAKTLVPQYGKTAEAVRKRYQRLKDGLRTSLNHLVDENK